MNSINLPLRPASASKPTQNNLTNIFQNQTLAFRPLHACDFNASTSLVNPVSSSRGPRLNPSQAQVPQDPAPQPSDQPTKNFRRANSMRTLANGYLPGLKHSSRLSRNLQNAHRRLLSSHAQHVQYRDIKDRHPFLRARDVRELHQAQEEFFRALVAYRAFEWGVSVERAREVCGKFVGRWEMGELFALLPEELREDPEELKEGVGVRLAGF
ncbi:hypothetical protein M501DRAFT_1054664 [Patellaria atrata CBS 101060]|uniref:Uncharacterized protein n=1 Tax=Patellaria atrata CBS 101060 TaxID=1346257 RepID=A0A9P4VSC4_9PEZI|nr:hypothetical protein M501DRAFT_1054664 [Patellaria atrata CBS 101060]